MSGTESSRQTGARPGTGPKVAESDASTQSTESLLNAVLAQLGDVRKEVGRLFDVQLDRARVRARRGIWRLGFALLFGLLVAALTLAAALRLLAGLAGGLATALGGRPWAGDLAAAAIVLGAVWLGAWIALAVDRRARLGRMERKYAERYPEPRKGSADR